MRQCKYCSGSGHNIATCRKLRDDISLGNTYAINYPCASERVKRLQKYKAESLGRNIPSHISKNPNTQSLRTARTCSYCSKVGHNARRCPSKKTDTIFDGIKERAIELRKAYRAYCSATGFGVGSLITFANGSEKYYKGSHLYMITDIKIDNIGLGYTHLRDILCVRSLGGEKKTWIEPGLSSGHVRRDFYVNFVSKVSESINECDIAVGYYDIVKNPSKCMMPSEMWENDYMNIEGNYKERFKALIASTY